MVQAIDRLRLIHSERQKTVCILCNIPLDIPVDGLVTWRQLIGDNRLAQALETCEEKGWNALPFAAGELTELFPELWGTARAAERWLSRNPLDPSISIIRLWGFLWATGAVRDTGVGRGPWCGMGPKRTWHSRRCWGCPPRIFGSGRAAGQSHSLRPIRSLGSARPSLSQGEVRSPPDERQQWVVSGR